MQGAGNDFVVLDETLRPLGLSPAQYRRLADRHFGVGADQILSVRAAPEPDVDFAYVIHNADGGEVEHCGNGARCFLQFVQERGLTQQEQVRVRTVNRVLTLQRNSQGEVAVDMGVPVFDPEQVPFVTAGLPHRVAGLGHQWALDLPGAVQPLWVSVASMGNPHVLTRVEDIDTAPVAALGPLIGGHSRFPEGVNVGFMQVVDCSHVRLRVFERGAGETLACGTGACAAVAMGIQLGWLDADVSVQATGGTLGVYWAGGESSLQLSGPAVTVYSADIELPD